MMKLKRFRVKNFRSIMDSGWIDCDDVTALVGINEAGKSNVLLALWKLNPVRDGQIDLLYDMPTKKYSALRSSSAEIVFITAEYELDNILADEIVKISNCDKVTASTVIVERKYDGNYNVSFPYYKKLESINAETIKRIVSNSIIELKELNEITKAEHGIKDKVGTTYTNILKYLEDKTTLTKSDFNAICEIYPNGIKKSATSEIFPNFEMTKSKISAEFDELETVNPKENDDVVNLIISEMPSFVYYSNYGNLDAQIYLPHAIKWLNGETVDGINNEAKVRTLRVLFDFVHLDPQEILELGMDPIKIIKDQYGKAVEKNQPLKKLAR